jgi:aminopeptidase N
VTCAVVVATTASGAAALPDSSYGAAVSHPHADSYYSARGHAGVDVLHYGLTLRWNEKSRVLHGTAILAFRATRDESSLTLDLQRDLSVDRAWLDGAPVDAAPGNNPNHLVVAAGTVLAAESRHRLKLRYHGTPHPVRAPATRKDIPAVGWTVEPDGQVWTMQEPYGAFTWYPVDDQPADKAYYDIAVTTKADWRAVANGRLVSQTVADGLRTTRWHLASPAASYLVTLAIGPYRHYVDKGPHGLPVNYWVRASDKAGLTRLRRSPAMLRWLEDRLGLYPFDRAGVVVVPGNSGMETQTLITLSGSVLTAPYGASDLLHEYVHQWYGDTVTPRDWKDVWLNESFATYVEIRWEAWQHRRDSSRYHSMHWWRTQLEQMDQELRDRYGPPGHYDKAQFASGNVYYCGALMLDRLRTKIGAHDFARLLRSWPQRHRFANADRGDWIAWVDATTGRHLDHWVRRWLLAEQSPA